MELARIKLLIFNLENLRGYISCSSTPDKQIFRLVNQGGQVKVYDFNLFLGSDNDVLWLQIPMKDTFLGHVSDSLEDLP